MVAGFLRKFRRRPGRKRGGRNREIKLIKKQLALVKPELKFDDLQSGVNANVSFDSPIITSLNLIAQGDNVSDRIGNSVRLLSVRTQFMLNWDSTSAGNQPVRVLLVLDKQCNGALPTLADLFEDATVTDSLISPFDMDEKFRFQILKDSIFTLHPDRQAITVKWRLKMNHIIRYGDTAGTIATVSSKNLILVMFSAIAEASNPPTVTHTNRVTYIDN